jgi:hypothetical protein
MTGPRPSRSWGTCRHCGEWDTLGHSEYLGPWEDPDAWCCLFCHLEAQAAAGEGYGLDGLVGA